MTNKVIVILLILVLSTFYNASGKEEISDYEILVGLIEKQNFEICNDIGILETPDPHSFHALAPNWLMTPERLEISVGIFNEKSFQILLGPFDWHPEIDSGWGTTISFYAPPKGVVVAIASFQGGDRTNPSNWELGCGLWGEIPNPNTLIKYLYVPFLIK